MRTEVYKGVTIFIPNETFDLAEKGCYVSYNPYTRDYGCDTTALVRQDGIHPTKFLILNGNHMAEYLALGHYNKCVGYFKEHLEMKNHMSENWDEEIIVMPDGTLSIRKNDEI